jgi:thymidylate kinase
MLILVEGVDRAGKSTFIGKLSSLFEVPVYRKPIPPEIAPAGHHEYFKGVGYAILGLHSCLDVSLIVDRSFISDFVYLNRRVPAPDIALWQSWEAICTRNNVLLAYISVDQSTQVARLAQSKDDFTEPADYPADVTSYETYLRSTRFCVARIDGTVDFPTQLRSLEIAIRRNPAFGQDSFAAAVVTRDN